MLEYANEMLTGAKKELKALTCHIDRLEKYHILSSGEIEKILKELENINRKIEILQGLRSEKAYDEISYLEERRSKGELVLKGIQKELEGLEIAISKEHTKIAELKVFISELEGYNA